MKTFLRITGWIFLVLGVLLCLLGLASLPTGGLMFALAYVFFIPGVILFIAGCICLLFSKTKKEPASDPQSKD